MMMMMMMFMMEKCLKDDCIQKQIKYIKDKHLPLFNALQYLSIESKACSYFVRFTLNRALFFASVQRAFKLKNIFLEKKSY